MARRKKPTRLVEKDVLTASRRRCCLCVYLDNRDCVRRGQIAHLNRDSSDSGFENLVFLCLEHHDEYDTRRSQSKGYLPDEVREYRNSLYDRHPESKVIRERQFDPHIVELQPLPEISEYDILKNDFSKQLNYISEPWRFPLWQVANQPEFFAYKAGNRMDGVCLIERIDIPDGRIVIACIQPVGNPGQSITNCVEELCFQVCDRLEIPSERLVWLEHYELDPSEEWRLVTFGKPPPDGLFEDPRWEDMTPDMWRDLRLWPKKRLLRNYGTFESKVKKLFHWPTEAIL